MYEPLGTSIRLPTSEGTLSAVIVFFGMLLLYPLLSGDQSADWVGYGRLYADQGGWLADQNRDSGFIWFVELAHTIYGSGGYEHFRSLLFMGFVTFAVWLVYSMPRQGAVVPISSLLTALVVLTTFVLKAFVQVREGIAFMLLLVPFVGMLTKFRPAMFACGIGALGAATFHAGTAFIAAGWLVAVIASRFSDSILASEKTSAALLFGALSTGLILGLIVIQNGAEIRLLLQDYGVDETAKSNGGVSKYLYWLGNGVLMLVIRNQVIAAATNAPKFAFSYALSLSSVIMPVCYAMCMVLVFVNFPTPALTAMIVRLFYTSTELGIIVVVLRGRGNLATAAISIFMLLDRLRLVLS